MSVVTAVALSKEEHKVVCGSILGLTSRQALWAGGAPEDASGLKVKVKQSVYLQNALSIS